MKYYFNLKIIIAFIAKFNYYVQEIHYLLNIFVLLLL